MSDTKINKALYDKLSIQLAEDLKNSVTDSRLTNLTPINEFDETIRTILKVLYDSKDPRARRFASVLNSIYTHATNVYVLTYALAVDLVAKDPHYKQNSLDGPAYRNMLSFALANGYIAELRKPVRKSKGVSGKAGLYELVSSTFLEPLSKMISATTLKANKDQILKWYDENNAPELEDNPSPEIIAERKRIREVMYELRKKRNET